MNVIDYNQAFIQAFARDCPRKNRTPIQSIPIKTRTLSNNEK